MVWDMVSWGTDWLDDQRRENMASTISYYQNGSLVFQAEDATSCRIVHKIMQNEVEVEVNGRDFIIPRSYFTEILPIAGDIISMVIGSETVSFRVAPIASEQVYRDHDPQRKAIRIHTILDEIE